MTYDMSWHIYDFYKDIFIKTYLKANLYQKVNLYFISVAP